MVNPAGKVQLLGPQDIRSLAAKVDITPTKKLGQNFVHDPNTVRKIIAAAQLTGTEHVLEVGPGLGSLTLGILEVAPQLTVVEIDSRLAAQLPETIKAYAPACADRLTVIERDALKITAADIAKPQALVANLPYNVSVPVIMHLLETFPSIKTVLVMVQLEVAQRLAAQPGNKIYGVPSLKASYFGQVKLAGTIGKNVFWPAPNIESGLVRIDRYEPNHWGDGDEHQLLFELIDVAFLQRRKTLRAALSGKFGGGAAAEAVLQEAGINPQARGEVLGVAEFIRLAAVVKAQTKKGAAC